MSEYKGCWKCPWCQHVLEKEPDVCPFCGRPRVERGPLVEVVK